MDVVEDRLRVSILMKVTAVEADDRTRSPGEILLGVDSVVVQVEAKRGGRTCHSGKTLDARLQGKPNASSAKEAGGNLLLGGATGRGLAVLTW